MKSLRVFISYSSSWLDERWVSGFTDSLNARGAVSTVSYADAPRQSDEDISRLEDQLLDCDLIVVFAGEDSTDAPSLFFEYGVALGADKEIVLVVPKGVPTRHLPAGIPVAKINADSLPSYAAKAVVAETRQLWKQSITGAKDSLVHYEVKGRRGIVEPRRTHKFYVRLKGTAQNSELSAAELARSFLKGLDVRLMSATRRGNRPGIFYRTTSFIDLHFEVLTTRRVAAEISRRIKGGHPKAEYPSIGRPQFRRRREKEAEGEEKLKSTLTPDFRRNDN